MAMRPVESTWYRDFIYNLTRVKTRYDDALSQTTSGKKLNHLSDNPADMAYVLTLRSKIGQIDQFEKNIDSASGFLGASESALNQVQNLLSNVVSLAEQGASESTGAQERNIIADNIDQVRDELMNYANSEFMGNFIFAGSATDTVPFVKAADTWDAVNNIWIPGVITYQGNSDTINIQADFSTAVATNVPGDDVFVNQNDIFDRLSILIQALRRDDTTTIGTQISSMNQLIDQISESVGTIGNTTSHLTQIKGMLEKFKTAMESKMSSLEDANMAEAISNLSREEVALQAALQAGARIQRFSLMNYLE